MIDPTHPNAAAYAAILAQLARQAETIIATARRAVAMARGLPTAPDGTDPATAITGSRVTAGQAAGLAALAATVKGMADADDGALGTLVTTVAAVQR